MKLVIIIPTYNEANSVVGVIRSIPRTLAGVDEIEVVVIDDGSSDETAAKVKAETKAVVVSHPRNLGVGAAFRTGVNYALVRRADLMVSLDADSQFNPADIPQLIKPILNKRADLATASRFIDERLIPNMPRIRLWGNQRLAWLISWLVKKRFYDVSCGFRAYSQEALLNLNLFGRFTYVQEVFLDLSFKGLKIEEVPLQIRYFPGRQSRIYQGVLHYAVNALKIILRSLRDYRPLKFFGSIGLAIFSMGLVLDAFVFFFFLQAGSFSPYKVVGIGGALLNLVGLAVLILALTADMLYRIRANQETLLYYAKKRYYYS